MKKEIKANHVFERIVVSRERSARAWRKRGALGALGDAARTPSKFKLDIIAGHSRGRRDLALSERRIHRSLRRPARHAHGQHRRVQAHARRQRLLQRRRKEPAAPAHLRHRLQEQDRSWTPTSPCWRRRRSATTASSARSWSSSPSTTMSAPACRSGCRGARRIIEELEKLAKETEFAAGYDRVRTPHIARENMYLTSGHLAVLRGVDVSADGAWTEAQPRFRVRAEAGRDRQGRECERCRSLLPQGDELPASPQALCGGAAQLSRPAVAPRGIRHLLSLRAERRTVRPHARAFACR